MNAICAEVDLNRFPRKALKALQQQAVKRGVPIGIIIGEAGLEKASAILNLQEGNSISQAFKGS